jgi:hypothetical protein
VHLGRNYWKVHGDFVKFEAFGVQESQNITLFQFHLSATFPFDDLHSSHARHCFPGKSHIVTIDINLP